MQLQPDAQPMRLRQAHQNWFAAMYEVWLLRACGKTPYAGAIALHHRVYCLTCCAAGDSICSVPGVPY